MKALTVESSKGCSVQVGSLKLCGKPAKYEVNGTRFCAECAAEFEKAGFLRLENGRFVFVNGV